MSTIARMLSYFNANQRQAITSPFGHLLINAGAGTGKTTTLAGRIIYLQCECGISPSSIVAISFSRSARAKLINKLESMCKELNIGSPVHVFTFHGLAYRIIRLATGYGETWLHPNFNIINASNYRNVLFNEHSEYLFNNVNDHYNLELKQIAYSKVIDEFRQGSNDTLAMLSPESLPTGYLCQTTCGPEGVAVELLTDDIIKVWRRYEKLMKRFNIIDYNGLIIEAIKILNLKTSEAAKRVIDGLKYLLVDEYQDTSRAQEQILFKLAGKQIAINVVGDVNQSIYAFNGSSVSNIINFDTRAKKTGLQVNPSISLDINYRSTSSIIELANRITTNQTNNRIVPYKVSERSSDLPVKIVHAPRISLAANYVANEILKLVNEGEYSPSDITVLVRKNTEYSPQAQEVERALEQKGIPICKLQTPDSIKSEQITFIYQLLQQPDNYSKYMCDIIKEVRTGTFDDIFPSYVDCESVIASLEDAYRSGAEFVYEAIDFLYDAISDENVHEDNTMKRVQIRTVHSSKGEEFRVVFLLYLGDRSFPHGSNPDIEEERRLLYVGITRAKERLYIIGRPGIHHEDFLGECRGQETSFESYLVEGNNSKSNSDFIDDQTMELIQQARKQQTDAQIDLKNQLKSLNDRN